MKNIKKILRDLIKEAKGLDGNRLIGEDYVMWRIIPMAERCKKCGRKPSPIIPPGGER